MDQTPSSNKDQTPSSNKDQTPSSNKDQTPSSNKDWRPEDLALVPRWVRPWIRGLPTPTRWGVGVSVIVGCVVVAWSSASKRRHPDAPQEAFWFTLLLFVVSVVLSELLRPKPNIEDARPKGLGDFRFPTATEDRPVPLLVGTVKIKGANVVDYGDLEQDAIQEKQKTGLWSSTTITKGFRYNLYIQFAICRGPGCVLRRVWIGDREVFSGTVSGPEGRFDVDALDLLGGDDFGQGGVQGTLDFYSGEDVQPANAYLDDDSRQRIDTAITPDSLSYPGTCHLVLREFTSAAPLASNRGAYVGNSTTIKPWAFEVQRFPALFSGQSAGHNIISTWDANPMNVAYELLTNVEWGFGQPASKIDVGVASTFLKASDSLRTEGNGMSMLIDSQLPAQQFLNEIQRQIDGAIFVNPLTSKWEVQLVREPSDANFGYDIDLIAQVTDSEIDAVNDFTRGSWEDTTNNIQVKFTKRADDYKVAFAPAQDSGNAITLSSGSLVNPRSQAGQIAYTAVMNSTLANNLAERELRGQSRPLARATFKLNRAFFDLVIGGVFAWTEPRKFPGRKVAMRVNRIDYGTLTNNVMTIEAAEDVFGAATGAMGDPPATEWTEPVVGLVAFPSAQQTAFEAPRGIVVRTPGLTSDDTVSKVWCGARRQGGEVAFQMKQRNASGAPAGSFFDAGDAMAFLRIGQLDSALVAGVANPTASILVNATPDTQTIIEALFDDAATLQDLGADLVQLIKINDEFMLVADAADSGADVALQNVYRGVLGTGQANHAINDDVFLIFVGGNLADTSFDNTFNVDVELRMKSSSATFAGGVTTIGLTMAKRALRPYPPSSVFYNGGGTPFTAPALEGDGAGLNGVGFDVDWRRSRYTTGDEVAELLADNPVSASTEYRVRVFVAPTGANDLAFTSAWVTGTGAETPTQAELVTFAAAGTEIDVVVDSRHDVASAGEVDLENRTPTTHRVTPTSARSSQFYLGGNLRATDVSNTFVVASATVHNVTIGAAYATSDVEESINGAGFTVVIAATGTTATLNGGAALSVSDTVRLRHTVNETPDPQFVEVDDGTVDVAYGAFSA